MVKNPLANAGDVGSIPGLGRCPKEGKRYPQQYSGLENSMDYTVHGIAKSRTRLRATFISFNHITVTSELTHISFYETVPTFLH